MILLNKVDTVDDSKISQLLRELHQKIPTSQVIPTIHCNVDPEALWSLERPIELESEIQQFFPNPPNNHTHGSPHYHHDREKEWESPYVAFSYQSSEPIDEDCFKRFAEEMPWELFRMKGMVRFEDRTVMVNHVGGRSTWTNWDGNRETRLAFVGWKVSIDDTIGQLKKCVLSG
jgi:G3E family GTPase